MTTLLSHPFVTALAWTLAHFVWQGAAIGFAAYIALGRTAASPRSRYLIGAGALAAMLAVPVATFCWIARAPATTTSRAVAVEAAGAPDASHPVLSSSATAPAVRAAAVVDARGTSPMPPIVVSIWLCGVLALSVRLAGGWLAATRLTRRGVGPVTPAVGALAQRLAGRLALDRAVRVVQSAAVSVPMTIGWIKPVVLLPVAALTGLGPDQIEALLAHELAHVRRHDFLVNLLQAAVETLLFFHPAVWWLSREVRTAREHCCDDLAISVCDRLVYATALADVAAMAAVPRLALAATDGPLVARVRRILAGETGDGHRGAGWIAVVVIASVVGVAVPASLSSAPMRPAAPQTPVAAPATPGPAGVVSPSSQATLPASSATTSSVTVEPTAVPQTATTPATQTTSATPQSNLDRQRADIEAQIALLQARLSQTAAAQAKTVDERAQQVAAETAKLRELQAVTAERTADAARQRVAEVELELRATFEQLAKAQADHDNESAAVLGPRIQALQKALQDLESQRWQLQGDVAAKAFANQVDAEAQRVAEAQRQLEDARQSNEAMAKQRIDNLSAQLDALADRGAAESLKREMSASAMSDQARLLSGTMGQLVAALQKPGSRDVLVLGAVEHPGVVSWENGLTADRAIAKAGGRTERADGGPRLFARPSSVTTTEGATTVQAAGAGSLIDIAPTTTLQPGAVVVVPWRNQ